MSTKKTPVKKAVAKKAVAKKTPVKKVVTTKKSELDKMIAKINEAKKNNDKSVVVYTTSKASHKANAGSGSGFGASDLKPSVLAAYKHLLLNYDLTTNLVSQSDMAVEWIVKIKK